MTNEAGPARTIPPAFRRAPGWAGWSTRTRMLVVVLAIDVIAALVSCGVIVLNARSAVKVETRASLATVELLVADTIRLSQTASRESLLRTLDLRFQALRHVRVAVLDAEGQDVRLTVPRLRSDKHVAPSWFALLIAPTIQTHVLPIVAGGARIGTAQITTEPLDEIDEVWGYAVALSLTTLGINLAMLAALYLAFGRVLAPLGRLAHGLTQLERHDYTARLDAEGPPEIAVIAERFNRVAEALTEARAANGRLNRQLLTAQDDERRRTALELHDEFGPCLFALEANAASVTRIAQGAGEPDRGRLAQRAADIGMIVHQVQTLNRDLLNRLRPHALGQVPLADCLNLLLRDFTRRHPGTAFTGTFDDLARGYGDLVDLTVFRCVQESMTNAVRHGSARHVRAEVRDLDGAALSVTVADDGSGLAPEHGIGLGISGMRERVGALDGTFALDNAAPGTVVRISIPLDPERGDDMQQNVSS
ncbi:ATP-binding protein [Methylobacterium planeticum]|uniref:Oxygen sensor histidine kinase NreB n=1 Tax=Methylobacterium planeticum TaxID=2615211 RepID=A0A6N6MXL3_9HYPH|nr:ATP-binding protein [Methylobacterium planeticum]KAB1073951.1 HAMP domain-containing protein [Methylobacterium planeticum]